MNKQVNSLTSYILENPIKSMMWFLAILLVVIVGITGFWPFFSTLPPMSSITFGLYNKDFWENFLVEAHGFLLDFIIFGVIVFGFDHLRAKRESNNQKEEAIKIAKAKAEKREKDEIERMLEELSDYADLDLPEVNRKKLGNVKRLQHLGEKVIDVTQLTLNGCHMRDLTFEKGSRLIGLQLQNGYMTNVSFKGVSMRSSYFNETKLTSCSWIECDILKIVIKDPVNAKGSQFIGCNMTGADLRNANLTGATFHKSDLKDVKFDGAILNRADLRDCKNLNLERLSKASSLNYLKIDEEHLEHLRSLRPDMKVPKDVLKAA